MSKVLEIDFEHNAIRCVPGHIFKNKLSDCVLLQFTGLLDKNGTEIYEGDILSSENTGPCAVEWGNQADQAAWMLVWKNKNVEWMNRWSNTSLLERIDLEVVGNIYEHPNLLKQ